MLSVIRMVHCFVSYGRVALTIGLGPRKCVEFLVSVVAVFVLYFIFCRHVVECCLLTVKAQWEHLA